VLVLREGAALGDFTLCEESGPPGESPTFAGL
jgi:hypothetical protein